MKLKLKLRPTCSHYSYLISVGHNWKVRPPYLHTSKERKTPTCHQLCRWTQ